MATDAPSEAKALRMFLESRGFKPSGRAVISILRELGLKFRDADVRDAAGTQPGRKICANGTQPGRNPDAASRASHDAGAGVEELFKDYRQGLDSNPPSPLPAKKPKPIEQPPLLSVVVPVKVNPTKPYETPECPEDLPFLIPAGEPTQLREMALAFVAAFANAGPEKAAKHLDTYAKVLAKAAVRRRTTDEAWEAFGLARATQGGKPLFGGTAWAAIDHLPFRPHNEPIPGEDDGFIRGCDLVATGEAKPITAADIPPWERPPFHPAYAPRPTA